MVCRVSQYNFFLFWKGVGWGLGLGWCWEVETVTLSYMYKLLSQSAHCFKNISQQSSWNQGLLLGRRVSDLPSSCIPCADSQILMISPPPPPPNVCYSTGVSFIHSSIYSTNIKQFTKIKKIIVKIQNRFGTSVKLMLVDEDPYIYNKINHC